MMPSAVMSFGLHRGEVIPDFLNPHDRPWIRELLAEFDRFAGAPERRLSERMQSPLRRPAPRGKVRMAVHVARSMTRRTSSPDPSPAGLRQRAFRAAADARRSGDSGQPVERARRTVALESGLQAAGFDDALFADLPGERALGVIPTDLGAEQLARHVNLALAGGLLARATEVQLVVSDNVRRIVRYAHLRGLICGIVPHGAQGTALNISGPLSLLRRTRLYAGALAGLLGQLGASRQWRLRARVEVGGGVADLVLDARDRICPDPGPPQYDSALERKFQRDFERRWPEWDAGREPPPIELSNGLLFPDFELARQTPPRRRWLLEIVGFWTPDYLEKKFAGLIEAGRSDLIVCVDRSLGCADPASSLAGPVILFKRRVDVEALAPFLES